MSTKKLRLLSLAVVFILAGWFVVCRRAKEQEPVNKAFIETIQKRATNPENIQAINKGVEDLQTGDMVLRTGNDVTSYMLSQMNQKDKTYSHCGLVVVESGYPFVYHSIGGEDNPDAKLRRDSAHFWFSPEHNLGFAIMKLELDTQQQHNLVQQVWQFYKEKKRFDMGFDLKTDDRLYCAEFVYKAVNLASGDSNYFTPTNILGYTFAGVDDLLLSPHARMICQIRYK